MAIAKKRFVPAIPAKAGKFATVNISASQLACLFTNPDYLYEVQRDHVKGLKTKKHVLGLLFGGAQQFSGAYCEETKRYYNLDGYHRGFAIAENHAWFSPDADIQLTVHRVKTLKDMRMVFDQYNSATSAKKSTCYFSSGKRSAGILDIVNSPWMNGSGKVIAVQYAAGIFGTVETAHAVVKMVKGIVICDAMNLPKTAHVKGSVKGACIAIAQYCQDPRLVELFISALNAESYDPSKATNAERAIMAYRTNLQLGVYGGQGGGGTATMAKFQHGLKFFVEFAFVSRKRKVPATNGMSLPQFQAAMELLGAKAA